MAPPLDHSQSPYDEAFADTGALRPAYRAFQTRTGRDPLDPTADAAAALSNRPLGDAFAILPLPLVLDDREYRETIAAGVRQRALALQSLFYDAIRGNGALHDRSLVPDDLFPRLAEQHGLAWRDLVAWWRGKRCEAVRFVYGPDLVRAPDARWWVLEDNVGCVGGVVDGDLVVERYLAATAASLAPGVAAGHSLANAVRAFLARVGSAPGARGVVAPAGADCSSESQRRRRVLEEIGVATLSPPDPHHTPRGDPGPDDIAAIVNLDMRGWSSLTALGADLFGRRGVPLMSAPGVDLLGNKALLPYLDRIVARYSGAEPILRTPHTEICHRLPDEAGWVIKKSDGCQGADVFFLDDLDAAARAGLEQRRAGWGPPERAVMQRYVRASTLADRPGPSSRRVQVELRPFAFVIGHEACLVNGHASGRGVRVAETARHGNMSQGALYMAVIREPTPIR